MYVDDDDESEQLSIMVTDAFFQDPQLFLALMPNDMIICFFAEKKKLLLV